MNRDMNRLLIQSENRCKTSFSGDRTKGKRTLYSLCYRALFEYNMLHSRKNMAFSARILKDSISSSGVRLTTFEVVMPRIVTAEFNTHRMLSRNSASSRAIPVEKRIAAVEADPFVPEAFGKNKGGMQATEDLDSEESERAKEA